MTWLPKMLPGEPTYMVQRYLFSVVTMTDVPTIPVTLSGIALLFSWRFKRLARQHFVDLEFELSGEPVEERRALS